MKKFLKKIKKGLNRAIKAIMNHKGISIGICCGVLVVILAIGIRISFSNKKEENNEKNLTQIVEDLGRNWYENHYYDAVNNNSKGMSREDFLKKYSTIGIKVDLSNLALHSTEGLEKLEEKKCSKEETKAIIYPQEPYGPKDYKIETIIQCTDENNENK